MSNNNKLPSVLNVEQLIKIFDAIERPKVAIASALAFFCGLRISEVCNLKIEDVDLEKQRLKVTDGKNSRRSLSGYGKDRYVPIPPQMISPIKKWIEIIDGGKWLFPSDKSPDAHIRKKSLGEQYREALSKTGLLIPAMELEFKTKVNGKETIKKITRHKYYFHTLRHSYATYLSDKGVDIYTISDLLGHNQVTTTQIYARISDTQRQRAINQAFNHQMNPYQIPNQNIKGVEERMLDIEKLKLEIKKLELENNKKQL